MPVNEKCLRNRPKTAQSEQSVAWKHCWVVPGYFRHLVSLVLMTCALLLSLFDTSGLVFDFLFWNVCMAADHRPSAARPSLTGHPFFVDFELWPLFPLLHVQGLTHKLSDAQSETGKPNDLACCLWFQPMKTIQHEHWFRLIHSIHSLYITGQSCRIRIFHTGLQSSEQRYSSVSESFKCKFACPDSSGKSSDIDCQTRNYHNQHNLSTASWCPSKSSISLTNFLSLSMRCCSFIVSRAVFFCSLFSANPKDPKVFKKEITLLVTYQLTNRCNWSAQQV